MKEKIYTIPLNESFDQKEGCPFCYLEDKLERQLVDYTLGPAMMEPDSREESNQTGFCRHHLKLMLEENKKLSLALMLSTHLETVAGKVKAIPEREASGFFQKKKSDRGLSELTAVLEGCVICGKLEKDRRRYLDVFFYMWEKEAEFREKVSACQNLCAAHGLAILQEMPERLTGLRAQVLKMLWEGLNSSQAELKAFIDLFDYRSEIKDPGAHKMAAANAAELLRGSVKNL